MPNVMRDSVSVSGFGDWLLHVDRSAPAAPRSFADTAWRHRSRITIEYFISSLPNRIICAFIFIDNHYLQPFVELQGYSR